MTDRSNTVEDGCFRVPWYHRRQRVPPGKCRKITENLVSGWKTKRIKYGQQYQQIKTTFVQWRGDGYERVFQAELQNARKHMRDEVLGHMFTNPRIVEDVTDAGTEKMKRTPLWPGGPSFEDLPGDARPDLPSNDGEHKDRRVVWDLWLTDYNPRFWEHAFGDCPFTEGKDLCSGPSVVEKAADVFPHCSWFRYHGTGLHSAITAISMNMLNRSEKNRGRPSPGDDKNPHTDQVAMDDRYETAVTRGIYSASEWAKARSYGIPYAPIGKARLTTSIVLLLRIPGSLSPVGVCFSVGTAGSKSYLHQKDLEGNPFSVKSNWVLMDLEANMEEVLKSWNEKPSDISWKTGFIRSAKGRSFCLKRWVDESYEYQLRLDPELQKRSDRNAMQTQAEACHLGEERWCNTDSEHFEYVSSTCAVVGFFVGYSVAIGKHTSSICPSRGLQAETSVDWSLMPPLCRRDDVEVKNAKLEAERVAGQPGSSGLPAWPEREDSPDWGGDEV